MCFWPFKRKKKQKETEKHAEEQVKKEEKVEEEKVEEEKVEFQKEKDVEVKDIYHVSVNRSEKSPHFKRWRVRKQGSNKTIKYFDTQAEAIDYANDLAEKVDGHIVIHKLDGTIRKQNY